MTKRLTWWLLALAALAPAAARGQGVLVVIDPNQHVRLPRPIFFPPAALPWSRRTKSTSCRSTPGWSTRWPRCRCRKRSRTREAGPWRSCFVFPLPYEGAIDQMTLMVDGKEYPGEAAGRQGSPADLRGDRAEEPRPGAVGMDGHGHVPDQRLSRSARREADRFAPLHAALPQAGGADRFPLPAEHGQVHVARRGEDRASASSIESQEEIKNVYSPTHAVEIKRPDDRHAAVELSRRRTRCPPAISGCSTTSAGARSAPRVLSYRPDAGRGRLLPALGQPADQGRATEAAARRRWSS